MCVGPGDPNRPFLTIIICEGAARASLTLMSTSAGQLIDTNTGLCVTLAGGVREPGALLVLAQCLPKYPTNMLTVENGMNAKTFKDDSSMNNENKNLKNLKNLKVEGEGRRLLPVMDFIAADHQVFTMSADGKKFFIYR